LEAKVATSRRKICEPQRREGRKERKEEEKKEKKKE